MRDLASAQMQVSKEYGIQKFDEFRKKMFPWTETAKKRDAETHSKVLNEAVKRGPLMITRKMELPKVRSRLIQRVEAPPTTTPEQVRKANELYKKLGKPVVR